MKIGSEISTKVNGRNLRVSGYYSDAQDSDFMLVNANTVKYNVVSTTSNIQYPLLIRVRLLHGLRKTV